MRIYVTSGICECPTIRKIIVIGKWNYIQFYYSLISHLLTVFPNLSGNNPQVTKNLKYLPLTETLKKCIVVFLCVLGESEIFI